MKSMLTKSLLTSVVVLILLTGLEASEFTGYFSLETVDAYPGDQVSVQLKLHENNVDFATLFIPIRYSNEFLNLDSVSFESSIKPDNFMGIPFDFPGRDLMQITYLPPFGSEVPSISSSGGVVGTLWLTVSAQATPGFLPVDTASIDSVVMLGNNVINTWIGAIMSNSGGDTIYFPDCLGGGVNVLIPTGVAGDDTKNLPISFDLAQNYPNPFNPKTVITYSIPTAGHVRLEVFNILGQSVDLVVDQSRPAGTHGVEFDASAYPSGIFFYRLTHEGASATRKMILVK